MYTDRKDLLKDIDDLKVIERKLIKLNGNDKNAIYRRFEAIERHEKNLTNEYYKEILKLELKKIALYELIDEAENKKKE